MHDPTIASGADSSSRWNFSSAFLRSVMSRIAAVETSTPVLGLERRQADLDRELAAVAAQAVELQPRAHRARARIGEVAAAVPAVGAAVALGHEHLDGLADQLGAGVAEELLGLRVDEHDPPVAADPTIASGADSSSWRNSSAELNAALNSESDDEPVKPLIAPAAIQRRPVALT